MKKKGNNTDIVKQREILQLFNILGIAENSLKKYTGAEDFARSIKKCSIPQDEQTTFVLYSSEKLNEKDSI
ncbi:MAG: hypothetical protein WC955_06345 [Elusimicrobiota bacterium]